MTNNQSSIGNSKLKNVWHLQAQLVGAEDTAMFTMFNTIETTEGRRIEKVDAIMEANPSPQDVDVFGKNMRSIRLQGFHLTPVLCRFLQPKAEVWHRS